MAKKSFVPRTDTGKALWLSNFASKLATYAAKYGITPAEITDMLGAAENFTYWLDANLQYNEFASSVVAYKDELRDGIEAGATLSATPAPPTLTAVPTPTAPGVFSRASSLGLRIKNHTAYTVSDGIDLGLEGAEETPDINNAKPVLTLRLTAGLPEILWKKFGFDGIEIHVCRAPGQPFEFLARDNSPNYIDEHPLPATGQSAVWKYKAIYIKNDQRVGQWSDEASVTVMG